MVLCDVVNVGLSDLILQLQVDQLMINYNCKMLIEMFKVI